MPQMHKWPTSFQAVDIVATHRENGLILLGKKPKEPHWRFPGGFVDPKDNSLEEAAIRERREECGIDLECTWPEYIHSFRVQDPRYTDSEDKIMSAVFLSHHLYGEAKAGDDLQKVHWFKKDYLRRNYTKMVMPVHHPIVEKLIIYGCL